MQTVKLSTSKLSVRQLHGWRCKGFHIPSKRGSRAAALPSLPELPEIVGHPGLATGALCNSAVFTLGYTVLRKGLTPLGVAHAWFLGTSVFSAFGLGGYLLVCLYFIFGTLVTKIKLEQKQKEGIAEARSGQRGPSSVWGSGIAGVACALLALLTGDYDVWQIGFVASFCSKLSDTVSSEIGKAYGQTTYLITSFQLVPRGTEGAVSLEGTLAGVLAAVLFAATALIAGQVPDIASAGVVAAAATVANLAESYLGASVQGRISWLNNDIVNMLQITLAAAIAIVMRLTLLQVA
ncbi:hypothetical protein VOLCADRAFT_97151 [Volvox carteri f. nagariensis]|uniref:Integral membrane protein n=1 Tax=Volvox carteri f. nagariensis TaxID=3068 RepID=D8UC05_VOLCA|nr:uncharacterized protein VOLCADRAFT_97151 [Volvox carteri f. nagariensis]EFJ42763.1 hypothetical protein VOLCADRAFT_97151 [Volvox carteri f. nagariensis]|eukprot:XP_002956224.1 hypothetical protein VOLCADRAFT_97151 [Volvox carteri f. nagariensis]